LRAGLVPPSGFIPRSAAHHGVIPGEARGHWRLAYAGLVRQRRILAKKKNLNYSSAKKRDVAQIYDQEAVTFEE